MSRNHKTACVTALCILLGLTVGTCKEPPSEGKAERRTKVKFILTDVDLVEAVVIAVIADHFGLELGSVIKVRREGNLALEDVVALFALLRLAESVEADFGLGLRGKGHGWGEVAHRLGIQAGVFNQLRRRVLGSMAVLKRGKWESDKDFREGLFIVVLSDCFGVEAPSINERFEKGNSLTDLILALALGRKSGVEWTKLLEERKKEGKTWLEKAAALGVDLAELDAVAEALKAPPEEEHQSKVKGKASQ